MLIKAISISVLAGLLSPPANAKSHAEYVPGEFIVKLKNNLSERSRHQSFGKDSRIVTKASKTIVVKRPLVEVEETSIAEIMKNDNVEYVEPNYIYSINKLPNDPKLTDLWGLVNTGQDSRGENGNVIQGKVGVDVDAQKAWEIQTGSKSIVVAVIDTGVDYTINELSSNMWSNKAEAEGKAGVDDDGNGLVDDIYGYDFVNKDGDPKDDHGHGSHCSGTIGAKGNDGSGLVGVNWNVSIMGVKFLSASGSGNLENAIKSIDYAREMKANIMSNSWGGGNYSQALEEAIQRANAAGILFVAAAGNNGTNNDETPSYPASYNVPNVISVAAIDNAGKMAYFTCYGKRSVHIAAPGVNIVSTTPQGYKSWSGTSMATPHVAGVAALLWANEKKLSAIEVKERLLSTARPLASLRGKVATNAMVNAYHALVNTQAPNDPDDPFFWDKKELKISTAHPYADNYENKWTVSVPGATRFAIYFETFDTEQGYDVVTITNSKGDVVDTMSGLKDGSYSLVIEGDSATVNFKTDGSVHKNGFDITSVSYQSNKLSMQ